MRSSACSRTKCIVSPVPVTTRGHPGVAGDAPLAIDVRHIIEVVRQVGNRGGVERHSEELVRVHTTNRATIDTSELADVGALSGPTSMG